MTANDILLELLDFLAGLSRAASGRCFGGDGLKSRHNAIWIEEWIMSWSRIDEVAPPIDRPVLIRTREDDEPVVAFLSKGNVWYEGGALVQNSMTVHGATAIEWCEPDGEDRL